jgi:hypothetical protein
VNLRPSTQSTRAVLAWACIIALSGFTETAESSDLSLKSIYHGAVGERVTDQFGDDSLLSALFDGTPTLKLRLGYEYSDLDNGNSEDGTALTLRTRLGYKTNAYKNVSAFVQWQHINNFVEDFAWPGGGKAGQDVIADSDGNRIHQAYVDFTGIDDTLVRFGLQEIIFDDARLIGNVGWRMQAQSFRGVLVQNKSIDDLTLTAAYLDKINTIFKTEIDMDSIILLHGNYVFSDAAKLSLFNYLMDSEGTGDSATWGAVLTGKADIYSYAFTAATQTEYADGADLSGAMFNAFGAAKLGDVNVGLGYSNISGGSNPEDRFSTLLGTAHVFNGWADQFLGTGGGLAGGLQDVYVQATTKVGKASLGAFYHRFYTTDTTAGFSGLYGQELDAVIKYPLCEHTSALIKCALYDKGDSDAGNTTLDEQVIWARLEFKF